MSEYFFSIRIPKDPSIRCRKIYLSSGSLERFIYTVRGAFKMPTLTVDYFAVRIRKLDSMIIVDFSIVFSRSPGPASGSLNSYGMSPQNPVRNVQLVNVLLDNMIATEPVKIIPVTHLVFHFCFVIFSWVYPYTPA